MAGLLEGRVAIVTGAGRGIGAGVARLFGAEGAKVVVADMGVSVDGTGEDKSPAEQVAEDIKKAGGEAVVNTYDVSDFRSGEAMIRQAVDTFGSIDILVNNAGIVRDRTLLKMTPEDYDAVIAVHQKGTFNCTRHAAPLMREAGYGRIVNITSSAGLRGNFGQTNYGAAKAAIMGMTFVWALELGRYGITVNAVAPAGLTRMTENLFGAQTSNVLANFTRWLGGIFFFLSLILSILYAKQSTQRSSIQAALMKSAMAAPATTPEPVAPLSVGAMNTRNFPSWYPSGSVPLVSRLHDVPVQGELS